MVNVLAPKIKGMNAIFNIIRITEEKVNFVKAFMITVNKNCYCCSNIAKLVIDKYG